MTLKDALPRFHTKYENIIPTDGDLSYNEAGQSAVAIGMQFEKPMKLSYLDQRMRQELGKD